MQRCLQQVRSSLLAEGGAQDDDGAVQAAQQGHQGIEQGAGVGVVGMHFVQDHHLARQAKGAHKAVLDVHGRHQGLVNGAHGKRCQQTAFGLVKPRAAGAAFFPHVRLL